MTGLRGRRRARAAITRICQWLDHWERQSDGGAWWPEIITLDELRDGHDPAASATRIVALVKDHRTADGEVEYEFLRTVLAAGGNAA